MYTYIYICISSDIPLNIAPNSFYSLPFQLLNIHFFSGDAQFLFFSVGGPVVGRDRYAAGAQAPHFGGRLGRSLFFLSPLGELTLFLVKYIPSGKLT